MRRLRTLWSAAGVALMLVACTDRPEAPRDSGLPDVYIPPPPDAGMDSSMSCDPGEIECSSGCTRVVADSQNCGSCGNACPTGVTCALGRCDCAAPMLGCDGVCLDPLTDANNCGACGNVCGDGEMCVGGVCLLSCDDPFRVCLVRPDGGDLVRQCVDVQSSVTHCGNCGTACAPGAVCTAGRCACPSGQITCGGRCVDVQTDANNCGSCGVTCGEGGVCSAGRCTGCGTGRTSCSGVCIDTSNDTNNCGACGTRCGLGEVCNAGSCECGGSLVDCSGTCVDTQINTRNCGGCGVTCSAAQVCSAGACGCAAGLTACGEACSDTLRDATNCGSCGNVCEDGEVCSAGVCGSSSGFVTTNFTTTSCQTFNHTSFSGADRGGIAMLPNHVLVTGATATARMLESNFAEAVSITFGDFPRIHSALFTDLATERAFILVTNTGGTQPGTAQATVTGIEQLSPTGGRVAANYTALSTPIVTRGGTGIFAGFGEVLLAVPAATGGALEWYRIALPSGVVTRLGNSQNPTHRACDGWAWWGIAERSPTGDIRATYVQNSTTIARITVPVAETTTTTAPVSTVSTFTNLGDMCSIVMSPSRSRWYFHNQGVSQFVTGTSTTAEIVGVCNLEFDWL